MATSAVLSLLDEFVDLGVLKVGFTGGEVALRSDLLKIVHAAAARHFVTTLKTSASLFTPGDIQALYEAGLHVLTVTVFHLDAERHDQFSGKSGAWQSAWSALSEMQRLGGKARMSIPVMGWNIDAVPALVAVAEEQRWKVLFDARIFPTLSKEKQPLAFGATDAQLKRLYALVPERIPGPRSKRPNEEICAAGHTDVHIQSNGDVWPCTLLPISLGNVQEKPFRQIWDESAIVAQLKKLTWGDSPQCMTCELLDVCARCPAHAFLTHGDFSAPCTSDCRLAKTRHEPLR